MKIYIYIYREREREMRAKDNKVKSLEHREAKTIIHICTLQHLVKEGGEKKV